MKTLQHNGTFIDQDCKISFQGKEFESGGAFICQEKQTGKYSGAVYASVGKNGEFRVTNWHGDIELLAYFGRVWTSNFGDQRRSVYFHYKGRPFWGMWCGIDFNEFVRVREIKEG